ncbi:MAG: DUF1501 domain-containing protein [Planctomycetota bacterium]
MHRRQFIQLGLAAAAAAATRRPAFGRVRPASSTINEPAMITFFLRGGNDALNTVIPYHDPDYGTVRGGLQIAYDPANLLAGSSTATNNGVGFHPALPKLRARFEDTTAGRTVAMMMRVGNPTGLRSHFTEQDIVETGLVAHDPTAPGWLPKLVDARAPYMNPTHVMSFAPRLTKLYQTDGSIPSAHFEAPYGPTDSMTNQRMLAVDYGGPVRRGFLKRGVQNAFGQPAPTFGDHSNRQVGADAIDAVDSLKADLESFDHDADYDAIPDAYLRARVEDAVQLMTNTETRYVGLEIGGFDTHSKQADRHTELLSTLDEALDVAYRKLADCFSNFLIVVVSEFGRTVEVNGSDGTDHGVGGLTIALGPGVEGGLYNCHQPSWQMASHLSYGRPWFPLNQSTNAYHDNPANMANPAFRDALIPAVDFRAHFAEIGTKFLGLSAADIGTAMGTDWGNIASGPLQGFLR